MRLSDKHSSQTLDFANLDGGLNWSVGQEQIADNELWQADNVEYDRGAGPLKTVDGVRSMFDAQVAVNTLTYSTAHAKWLFSSGTTLYSTDLSSKASLGTLSGTSAPFYTRFGNNVFVASGGTLQIYDGATLETVTDGPTAHYVTDRFGRLVTFDGATDTLRYSGIGDYTDWDTSILGDDHAKDVSIGYKDPGTIVAVVPLSQDLLVFKSSGRIYRVVGEPPDQSVYEVDRDAYCIATGAACGIANMALFVGPGGFRGVSTTQTYGDMAITEPGEKVNPLFMQNYDANARVWHAPNRKQVWVKGQNDKVVYLWHYAKGGAWTRRLMTSDLNDLCTYGTDTYLAIGNTIGKLDRTLATELSTDIPVAFESKRKVARNALLVKEVSFDGYAYEDTTGTLSVGRVNLPFTVLASGDIAYSDDDIAYSDTDPAVSSTYFHKRTRQVARLRDFSVSLVTTGGSIGVRSILVKLAEV